MVDATSRPFEELKDQSRSGGKLKKRLADSEYLNDLGSNKKEGAIVKVISHLRGHSVKRALTYIERGDKEDSLPGENENGERTLPGELVNSYDEWKSRFEPVDEGKKNQVRHATHMMLSIPQENTHANARILESVARDLLREQFGEKGYQYVFVVHRDTENPHAHVIVNNYHRERDGPKLRLNQPELFVMRTRFAELLNERGLEQKATLKRDRAEMQRILAGDTLLIKEAKNWLESKAKTASMDAVEWHERKAKLDRIVELRALVKSTGHETEQTMQALDDLRQLSRILATKEEYRSFRSAVKANKGLMSTKGKYHEQINALISNKKPLRHTANAMAFDVISAKKSIAINPNLTQNNKDKLSHELDQKLSLLSKVLTDKSIKELEKSIRVDKVDSKYKDYETAVASMEQLFSNKGMYKDINQAHKKIASEARKIAFDIAEAEIAIKGNPKIKDSDKGKLLSDLDIKMNNLSEYLPSGAVEKTRFIVQQRTAPDNEQTARLARFIEKLDRSTPKLEEKKRFNDLSEKHLNRVFDDYFTARREFERVGDIPQWRKKGLEQSLAQSEKHLAAVANVEQMRKKWNAGRDLDQRFRDHKILVSEFFSNEKSMGVDEKLKAIDDIQRSDERLKKTVAHDSYDKKQAYTINVSLQRLNKDMYEYRGKEANSTIRELNAIKKGIESLNTKEDGVRAKYQGERLGLRITSLQEKIPDLVATEFDKRKINERLAQLPTSKHVDIDVARVQHKAIANAENDNKRLNVQATSLADKAERRQLMSAIEIIDQAVGPMSSDIPKREQKEYKKVREAIKETVINTVNKPVKQKIAEYYAIEKEASRVADFAKNASKKYANNPKGLDNVKKGIDQRLNTLMQNLDKSTLPERLRDKIGQKLDKELSKIPALKDKAQEINAQRQR